MARSDTDHQVTSTSGVPESLESDLGWGLSQLLHGYAVAVQRKLTDLPAGLRGYHVLTAVSSGCPGTQLELGRQLGIDRSVMTNLLDRLEDAGLIERRPDPADRRARLVNITEKGATARQQAAEQIAQAENAVLGPLTEPERAALRKVAQRLAVHAYTGGAVSDGDETACSQLPAFKPTADTLYGSASRST